MRLCLLNLFLLFIEKFEITEYAGIFNCHVASSHPVNLLFCHLSSNEIQLKLSKVNHILKEKSEDLISELFFSDHKFIIDFSGSLHYSTKNSSRISPLDISNISFVDHVFQREMWKLNQNSILDKTSFNETNEVVSLIESKYMFKSTFFSERSSIFIILSKIAICNEFTMKLQVENTLNYLSSYPKSFDKSDAYGYALTRTQQPFQSLLGLTSPTKTLMNTNNNLNLFDVSNFQTAKDSNNLQNVYWCNGVAYSGDKCSKEKIRRKSDMFLIRITNSICYKISNIPSEDLCWCEELSKDMVLLSEYILKTYSRILIFQIIDTVLNPLLAIKRMLIDIILKDRRTLNVGTGVIQSPFLNVDSCRAPASAHKSPNFTKFKDVSSNRKNGTKYEKAVLELLSSYLNTMSSIILLCKTQETYKMVAEVIIKDSLWQETVQTFTEFLFKSDLLTEIQKNSIQSFGKKTLISIDESALNIDTISKDINCDETKIRDVVKCLHEIHDNIRTYSNQARSAINYYQCINILIKNAFEDSKDKNFISDNANPNSGFGEVVAEVAYEFEDDECDHDDFGHTHSIEPEHQAQDNKADINKSNKYWSKVQKTVLYNYAFMIAPANGVLVQYLDHHGTDYSNQVKQQNVQNKNNLNSDTISVPISFLLTTTVLKFCETLFTSADKTLYNRIFTDELALSFIRTHWICFVRLYNRSFKPATSEAINPFTFCFSNKQYDDEIESLNCITPKIALLTLCKLHLKCVCVMANNRSEIIRKNLLQFKILDFCVREIDLEYEESVEKEEREQRELFSIPYKVELPKVKEIKPHASCEMASYQGSVNSNYDASSKKVLESPDINQDQIKPVVGFNLSLDLSKVAKSVKPKVPVVETKAPNFDNDLAVRSSLGNNSEMAHPINISYKANDAQVPSESSSSSSDYDFVPPPELNPNLYYPEKKPQPVLGKVGLGGLGFKLNLSGVPTAHVITDEDKSRVQALKESKPETFNNTVNLKLTDENASKEELKFDESNTTTKAIAPPKLPGFGGFGLKLDLTKVPTAHVITDDDKQKCKNKEIPTITKNNFTDSKEIKGSKPKKLNLRGKDSTTKITNDVSFPDLKAAKRYEESTSGHKKRKFKKKANPEKEKDSRNTNVSKMKSLVIENSEASSLLESNTDDEEYKMPLYKRKIYDKPSNAEIEIRGKNLTPIVGNVNLSTSQISKASDNSKSDISNGSFVGSNKVFVPFLNIQEDVINKEAENKRKKDEEIKNKRESDKSNPRFQMKRSNNEKKDIKNLAKAKNDKLLNISNNQESKPNPFALNLSRVQTKGEPPKVKDNSFFENAKEKESWDVKAISESENRYQNNEATVTLGPIQGADKLSSQFSIKLPINVVQSETQNTVIVSQNEVYDKERNIRGIYHDDELHALIIYLIFCLILTPQRGTLDDLYCSRYPLMDGKPPVLHFLHFHLNHSANQSLIPLILKKVEKQFIQNSGVRLLKLLCTSMFDKSLYQDSTLIAKGAYGNVYQCKTLCEDPDLVAIKQMNFPPTIENRCSLYDVFTEVHIASFEAFREKSSVVDIYDYGVDSTGYHLIMKRYKHSLKEWRVNQSKSLKENLSLYLSLYKDILKAVELFHTNNVTHYDIKADNIFLDVTDNEKQTSDSNLTIALGDLGECKMFISEEDEFCEKNRGTEVIMSPEMFMLAINIRKNTEKKYDRRK